MKKIIPIFLSTILMIGCAGEPKTAEEITNDFFKALNDGKCDDAIALTTGDGTEKIEGIKEAGCEIPEYDLNTISCVMLQESATCECTRKEAGIQDKVYLKKKDDSWIVEDYNGIIVGATPEMITEEFAQALADGECDRAMEWAIEEARESVQALIDVGCEKYQTEIKSVECDIKDTEASCSCIENREGMEMTFIYELKRDGSEWKVKAYNKDLGMDIGQ